jgi:hypothetical protein
VSDPSSSPSYATGRALSDAAARLRERTAPAEQRRTGPPKENGVRLATIRRGDDEEGRLSWAEYNGRHFLNVRVWNQRDGNWWPDKAKGMTVRLRELAEFANGVAKAVDLAVREPRNGA